METSHTHSWVPLFLSRCSLATWTFVFANWVAITILFMWCMSISFVVVMYVNLICSRGRTWNRFFFVSVTGCFVEPVFQCSEHLVVVVDYASVVMWTHRFPHSDACSGANGWQDHKMRDQHYFYDAFRTCPYCGRVLDGHSVADYTVSVSLIQCLVMLVMSTHIVIVGMIFLHLVWWDVRVIVVNFINSTIRQFNSGCRSNNP